MPGPALMPDRHKMPADDGVTPDNDSDEEGNFEIDL